MGSSSTEASGSSPPPGRAVAAVTIRVLRSGPSRPSESARRFASGSRAPDHRSRTIDANVRCYPNDDDAFRACVLDLLSQEPASDPEEVAARLTVAVRSFYPAARIVAQTALGSTRPDRRRLYAYRDGRFVTHRRPVTDLAD
jgi:hypothetical protein